MKKKKQKKNNGINPFDILFIISLFMAIASGMIGAMYAFSHKEPSETITSLLMISAVFWVFMLIFKTLKE